MTTSLPLAGVRVQLSGSIPESATPEEALAIQQFVGSLACAIFSEGGTVVHGSHPSLEETLGLAAVDFVKAGGSSDALTLVRSQKYAKTSEHLAEIELARTYAVVHIIPTSPSNPGEGLLTMREWIIERSDAVVAVGGKWYDTNRQRAGVPIEVMESIVRRKPVFLVGGFGGAVKGMLAADGGLLARLRNGLGEEQNRAIAESNEVRSLVQQIVQQLKRLPLVRETIPSGRMFRILALDGGGIRGAFTAAVLAKWDEMLGAGGGNNLVKNFDLVAGTSTGAILAIGLGLGVKPLEILDFYRTEGPNIFPKNRELRHWLKSKNDSTSLRQTLKKIFKEKTLAADSCCRLVIPTVRAESGETDVIVTPHHLDRTAHRGITAVDAAMASSAAPTYFDEAHVENEITSQPYLDGGIWANNPILPAISEAVRHLGVPLDRIDVLSVGTIGSELSFVKSLGKGKWGWKEESIGLFFAAQEHAAVEIASSFLTRARHLRVNQQSPTPIPLDDTEAIDDMVRRGDRVGADMFSVVRSRFLDGFHAPDWRT